MTDTATAPPYLPSVKVTGSDYEARLVAIESIIGRGGIFLTQRPARFSREGEALDALVSLAELAAENGETYHYAMRAAQLWLQATKRVGYSLKERMWGFDFIILASRAHSAWVTGPSSKAHFPVLLNWLNEARIEGLELSRGRILFNTRLAIETYCKNYRAVLAAGQSYAKTMFLAGVTVFPKETVTLSRAMQAALGRARRVGGKVYASNPEVVAYARLLLEFAPRHSPERSGALLQIYHAAKDDFETRRKGHTMGPRMAMHARAGEGEMEPLVLDNMVVSARLTQGDKDKDVFAVARRTPHGLRISWGASADYRIGNFEARARKAIEKMPSHLQQEAKQNLTTFLRTVRAADENWKQKKSAQPDAPNFADYLERNMARLSAQVAAAAG